MCKTTFWMSALLAAVSYPALADQWSKSFQAGAFARRIIHFRDGRIEADLPAGSAAS